MAAGAAAEGPRNGGANMTNDGILAIWHGVRAEIGDEYERWYFREHLPERVGVPGFVAGRRYEAVSGSPRFLTYYEAKNPEVFVSKPYIDRLNDPTPWTTEVLQHFHDTNRTVCRRTWEAGGIRGAWAMALRVDRSGEDAVEAEDGLAGRVAALEERGRAWAEDWRVLRVEIWRREALPSPERTAEAKLRAAPDRFIEGAVLAHFAREEDARSAAGAGAAGGEAGVYRLLCELRSGRGG